jgi:hypothetical protein
MQSWARFYAAVGTTAAALLGLLFVAVSVNVSAALGPEKASSRRLTEQAFQNYLAVMMVAFLALFPDIGVATFGMVTLIATASWTGWVIIRFCQTLTQHQELKVRIGSLRRHLPSVIGFGIFLVSALSMALSWAESHNWVAASMLVLLFSATTVSWQLLKQIAGLSSG